MDRHEGSKVGGRLAACMWIFSKKIFKVKGTRILSWTRNDTLNESEQLDLRMITTMGSPTSPKYWMSNNFLEN